MRIIYNIASFLSSQSGIPEQGKTAKFQILEKIKLLVNIGMMQDPRYRQKGKGKEAGMVNNS
ncbi:MAG: hypothetical protein BMS9Abin21_050 [Thermodesulfovibrionia bacterium]|nr:MAG: hypothetical protein BMS9Abin21_050 [Thermodesulfovibrionia bacterium]